MSNGLNTDAPVARLCHIIQLEDFDGYGFNLHAEKGKPGQFIGKVDEGSPAEAAGLKLGDRIIEVNGVNIANDNHRQVVQRIKSKQNETELLVVDSEADTYFKSNNITIHSGLPDILHLTTPITASTKIDSNEDKRGENSEDTQSQKSVKSVASADHEVLAMDNSAATTPSSERKHSPAYSPANSPEPQADSADEVSDLTRLMNPGTLELDSSPPIQVLVIQCPNSRSPKNEQSDPLDLMVTSQPSDTLLSAGTVLPNLTGNSLPGPSQGRNNEEAQTGKAV
uniref:PDZ domain-containing protein n=1 Tax=Timema monikensis TaxID=170555 RepID=A0A7R9HJD7_9NEOP|nr:unnamed protein product [Timema monikensis]